MSDEVERRYGLPVALSSVVGIVIGVGIFFKAKPVLEAAGGNPKIAITAWILGALITIFAGLTAAEIGAAIPEPGGMMTWIRKLYGEKIGFLVGWCQTFIYQPGIVAVLAYYFIVFTFDYLGTSTTESTKYMLAIATTTFVYGVNIYTRKGGGYIQASTTLVKLIPLVAILIFGMLSNNNPEPMIMSEEIMSRTSGNTLSLIGVAIVPVMFAFDGWILVGTIAGDLKNVKKTLPRAIIIGIGVIGILYVGINIAILKVFPAEELMKQDGLSDIAKQLFGNSASKLIILGIAISAFGGLNGNILVSTRLAYALSLEGVFPKSEYFKEICPESEQPKRSSWLAYIITVCYLLIMLVTNDPETLSNIPIALFFFFYLLVFFGVFILRKKYKNIERSYQVPFYPIIPILAILGGIYILYSAILKGPLYMLVAILLTLSGLFFYKKRGLYK